ATRALTSGASGESARLFAISANRRSISFLRRVSSSPLGGGRKVGGGMGGGATAPTGKEEGSSLLETGTADGPEPGRETSEGLWSHGGCWPASTPGIGMVAAGGPVITGSGGTRTVSAGRACRYSFARFAA